jgi:predicted dehydrogenase/nucleoside-diphosphate-sugar epimerase
VSAVRRVGLVGAGFIARAHVEALRRTPGVRLAAVIDPQESAARGLAAAAGSGVAVFTSVAAALAAGAIDCAHVLVPPDRHAEVAAPLLAAGKPVLLEKPLAASGVTAQGLVAAAAASGATLGVNQNFVHHPAFGRLRAWLTQGSLGPARHVDVLYNVGLRQMAARQFGHWMFQAPVNLLLEQAVHPLSQLAVLAGPLEAVSARFGLAVPIGPGQALYPTLDALLAGPRLTAGLRFAVGQSFPFWQVRVVCDDGVAVADILANRSFAYRRTRWMDAVDGPVSGARIAGPLLAASAGNLSGYVRSLLRLGGPGDPFQASMTGSVAAFHAALDAGVTPQLDGVFGAALVGLCERLGEIGLPAVAPAGAIAAASLADAGVRSADAAGGSDASADASVDVVTGAGAPHAPAVAPPPDIALLGGTGFIGTHLARACLAAGLRPVVMARSLRGLPDVLHDPRVRLVAGNIRDPDAVARAIAGAPVVVNLAHGGGGATFEQIRDAMVGGAETVARACLAAARDGRPPRLVHVGSIASLYLGPQPAPVTGATPPDPEAERRGDYARAKALSDRMLLDLHAREGLPVVILRPGVVVGEGGPPFHSGVGLFNNDQHCIGWNAGRNPLPFVLAGDVAGAILAAARAEGIEGRCYNLAGDVRPSAREYLAALARVLGRPLQFHPQTAERLWLVDMGKWAIKRAGGRRTPMPSLRDLRSRGMEATLDCADAKRDLGWTPVAEPAAFEAAAIAVHVG